MYWRSGYVVDNNKTYIVYNYFDIVKTNTNQKSYFNPVTRTIKYPILKELVIKTKLAQSEAEFLTWYNSRDKLLS